MRLSKPSSLAWDRLPSSWSTAPSADATKPTRRFESAHDGLGADLRHAVRAIRLEPGFSAIVILTLAIGIGACTTVFSFINALLWGSLPYPQPDRLVVMGTAADRSESYVALPVYEDWRREAPSESMGLWEYLTFNVASDDAPEQVRGIRATSSLFEVLGVPPALGRVFTEAEEGPGHRVAVVSDSIWRTHLGGHGSAIGAPLRLNGEVHEVIGVMPSGFQFPWRNNGVWIPLALTRQDRVRGAQSFWVAARLRPVATFSRLAPRSSRSDAPCSRNTRRTSIRASPSHRCRTRASPACDRCCRS